MAAWIDFKKLRQDLDFLEVLAFYNVPVKVKGERATGLCPLPGHPKRERQDARTASFSCHLGRKIWHCFGCQAGGNILDLAVLLEGNSRDDAQALRSVALKLASEFGVTTDDTPTPPQPVKEKSKVQTRAGNAQSVVVNPPLDFELQGLDPEHPYFKEHGITPEIVKTFGLGYCQRGMLKFRIAIPLHCDTGQLVGYAGRLTKDSDINNENPKYRFPGDRERDGVKSTFAKSRLVYNLHRLPKPVEELVIVEGFRSVWWLTACGHPNVVAVMGSSCSPEQAELIENVLDNDARVVFLTDGDDAGAACAVSLFREFGHRRFCRWVKLDNGLQPTDLSELQLSLLLRPEE